MKKFVIYFSKKKDYIEVLYNNKDIEEWPLTKNDILILKRRMRINKNNILKYFQNKVIFDIIIGIGLVLFLKFLWSFALINVVENVYLFTAVLVSMGFSGIGCMVIFSKALIDTFLYIKSSCTIKTETNCQKTNNNKKTTSNSQQLSTQKKYSNNREINKQNEQNVSKKVPESSKKNVDYVSAMTFVNAIPTEEEYPERPKVRKRIRKK